MREELLRVIKTSLIRSEGARRLDGAESYELPVALEGKLLRIQ